MSLRKLIITGAVAGAALLATTAASFAAPAVASANVNVRSGPGPGYRVVDTLRRGERVEVDRCRSGWCFVEKRGPDGWVSARYLNNRDDRPRPPRRPRYDDRYDWYDDYPRYPYPRYPRSPRRGYDNGSVCFNGPNGYFCFGS